jgi:hypothetical protein
VLGLMTRTLIVLGVCLKNMGRIHNRQQNEGYLSPYTHRVYSLFPYGTIKQISKRACCAVFISFCKSHERNKKNYVVSA